MTPGAVLRAKVAACLSAIHSCSSKDVSAALNASPFVVDEIVHELWRRGGVVASDDGALRLPPPGAAVRPSRRASAAQKLQHLLRSNVVIHATVVGCRADLWPGHPRRVVRRGGFPKARRCAMVTSTERDSPFCHTKLTTVRGEGAGVSHGHLYPRGQAHPRRRRAGDLGPDALAGRRMQWPNAFSVPNTVLSGGYAQPSPRPSGNTGGPFTLSLRLRSRSTRCRAPRSSCSCQGKFIVPRSSGEFINRVVDEMSACTTRPRCFDSTIKVVLMA